MLVDRERELDELNALLDEPVERLLPVMGPSPQVQQPLPGPLRQPRRDDGAAAGC